MSLPHPDSLRRPSSTREAEQMLELGRKMLSMSLQWAEKEQSLSSLEVEALQGLVSTILAKVKVGDTRLSSLGIILICCRSRRRRECQGGCHHLHQVNESEIFQYMTSTTQVEKGLLHLRGHCPPQERRGGRSFQLSWFFGNIKKAGNGMCAN